MKDRRKWTPEEDALLTQAMKRFRYLQDVRWTEVAASIPDRTPKACRKRWVNGLNGRLKKGSWSSEEDERLRQGVALLSSDWARIAEHVGQRSGDQCSKRWREVLDPAINKSPWTPEEDKLLTELYQTHGSAWQIISTNFNNRRALQCRNRCCKLLGLHGSSKFMATPSLDTASDNAGAASGELVSNAPTPPSPFGLAFPALPTPISTCNQDEVWPGNFPLEIPQNANVGVENRCTVGSLFNAPPATNNVTPPLFGDSMGNSTDCSVNTTDWSLAPAANLSEHMDPPTDLKLNLTTLDQTNDLFTQQLFASPGTMTPQEPVSGPSTPSLSLSASRCNSGMSMSPVQPALGYSCISDINCLPNYPFPPGQPSQSTHPCIQGITDESVGPILLPMNNNFSFSIGMPKNDPLVTAIQGAQYPLQWMTGFVKPHAPQQYTA